MVDLRALGLSLATITAIVGIPNGSSAQTPPGLIAPEAVTYLGAFRLPAVSGPGYSTWGYSNGPIAYYPHGDASGPDDGFPGSLFMAGHVYESRVAELDIPVPVISQSVSALPRAGLLQQMSSVTSGLAGANGFIMGMTWMPSQGRFFFTIGSDYNDPTADCNVSDMTPGLASFAPTLLDPRSQGTWFLSRDGQRLHPYQSTRWIMEVPQAWADANLAGRSLVTGRYRGWCPEGPSLYASGPWSVDSPPASGSDIPATTLFHPGAYLDTAKYMEGHGYANAYRGAVWLTAGTRHAAVVSGVIDFDPSRAYYGYENWTSPNQCEPSGTCSGGRGWRAAKPHPAMLLFDPAVLREVATVTRSSWDVDPYARIDLANYMLRNYPPTFLVTGATGEAIIPTYDRARGILYVSESFADGDSPVVHAFRVAGVSPDSPPAPPTNLRIVP